MLASLLPGLRDLRAPLAAGFLWLLLAWLALDDSIRRWRRDETSSVAELVDLLDGVSPGGRAVAASFAAYVLGSLSVVVSREVTERFRGVTVVEREQVSAESSRKREELRAAPRDEWPDAPRTRRDEHPADDEDRWFYLDRLRTATPLPDDLFNELQQLVATWATGLKRAFGDAEERFWQLVATELFGRPNLRRRPGPRITDDALAGADDQGHLVLQLAQKVGDEYELIANALLDERSDLFGPIDRLRGELDFRVAIAPPLALSFAYLAVAHHVAWVVGLAVVAGLVLDARRLRLERNRFIGAALTVKPMRSPTLNRLERAALGVAAEADALTAAGR